MLESIPEGVKLIAAIILMALSNYVTYRLARPKTVAEISKAEAETERAEAETLHTTTTTISNLIKQIDGMVVTVKELRGEVATLEDVTDTLKEAVKQAKLHEDEELLKLHSLFSREKANLLEAIEKAIVAVSKVLRDMKEEQSSQTLRMKAVSILEILYSVRDKLQNGIED